MSFPRYPEYKDSGVEWLGEVPGHWEIVSLKWLADLQSGEAITSESIEETGDYPVYGGNGIRGYTAKYTHEGTYPLIGRQGALCGNINYSHKKFWASEHAVVVTLRQGIVAQWLGELLRAMNLGQYSVSAAQPGLSVDVIRRLPLPMPPTAEQSAIATFLDRETGKIDALVAEQEKLVELLKEKRQAVISHAVTKGLDPTVPMKDSGIEWLGEVPEHWGVLRLKFVAQVQSGVAKGRDLRDATTITVPYLRVANVQDGYLDLTEVTEIDIANHELSRFSLQFGDVLMNEGGDFDKLGRGHIWRCEINPCIHQNHVFAVRCKYIEPEWLNILTSAASGRFYFMSRSKQSTNLASISSTNICEFPMVCPPAGERELIINHVRRVTKPIDDLIVEAQHAIDLLKERRSALISAAVTGKIDVRGFSDN